LVLVGTAVAVTTVTVVSIPHLGFNYGQPAQQVALETTASLVALLAGFLVFGRLLKNSWLNELALVAAFAVIAASNVNFILLPMLTGSAEVNHVAWSAILGRLAGGLLFALAAFVPRVKLRQPRRAKCLMATGVALIVIGIGVVPWLVGSALPQVVTAGSHRPGGPELAATEVVTAVLAVIAVAGYQRRSRRLHDELSGWLAIAATFAAAAHVNYALDPTVYSDRVSLGDIFRFCFYLVLLIGSMREIWSYWRRLTLAIVAEERQRIARDLHDGLSQELAYLTRNLSGLQGTADESTLHRLRVSVDRARLACRQAVHKIAGPERPPIADALTEAAREVAERFGLDLDLDLDLDLAQGIGVTPARADALVRIACEALTNVARHSGCRRASLVLRRERGRVRLRVRDSGRGFDAAASRAGFGLVSMRDRARAAGGELRVSSVPGEGSQVEATL
jgi:signal transduction histidine kinase